MSPKKRSSARQRARDQVARSQRAPVPPTPSAPPSPAAGRAPAFNAPPIDPIVLPFNSDRPPSIPPSKESGLENKRFNQTTLKQLLSLPSAVFNELLLTMEVVFDATKEVKPTAETEFRWYEEPVNTTCDMLNSLPFDTELVRTVLSHWDMSNGPNAELAFYLYHAALATKKRVERRANAIERISVKKQLEPMLMTMAWQALLNEKVEKLSEETASNLQDIESSMVEAIETVEATVLKAVELKASKSELQELGDKMSTGLQDLSTELGDKLSTGLKDLSTAIDLKADQTAVDALSGRLELVAATGQDTNNAVHRIAAMLEKLHV